MIIDDDKTIVQMLEKPDMQSMGFRWLMQKYGQRLYWHIRRIVISHVEAEKAFQKTCMKIYSEISSLSVNYELLTYIYRIATNEALRLLRKQTKCFSSVDSLRDELKNVLITESEMQPDRPEMLLQQALLQHPTWQRIAFSMRYFDNLTYEQIAIVLGKNVAMVETNYHKVEGIVKAYITKNVQ